MTLARMSPGELGKMMRNRQYIQSVDDIQMLLDYGMPEEYFNVDPSSDDPSPLMIAIHNGSTEVIQYLLAAGVNVNHQSESGETALHVAAVWGDVDYAKMLLDAGARYSLDYVDEDLRTPLHYAAERGDLEMCKLFLEHHVDKYAPDYKNNHPWDLAPDWLKKELPELNPKPSR